MKLSENFTLEELLFSTAAVTKGIGNKPNDIAIGKLKDLCVNILQPLREYLGEPLKIYSGFRSQLLNAAVGGANSSQHLYGEAADIGCGKRNAEIFKYIKKNLDYDQLIWEFGDSKQPDWIHVSFRREIGRKQSLKAQKIKGKTVYTPL